MIRLNGLAEEADLLRAVFEQVMEPLLVLDGGSCVVAANPAAERMLGLPPGGAAGWVLDGLFPPGREAGCYEAVLKDPRGRRREVEVSASRIEIGGQTHIAAFLRDITTKKEGEREARRLHAQVEEAKRSWEETVDSLDDCILILDRDCVLRRVNRQFRVRAERPFREIVGRPLAELVGDETARTVQRSLAAAPLAAGADPVEVRIWDGTFELSTWPRTGAEGDRGGAVVVLSDVTERRRLRDQLLHSEKLSALGELISGIAHELNNPLTGVLGYAQILSLKDKEGRFGRELTHLREESLRASRIVRNLLTFARRHEPCREPEDLNEVVRRTVALREYDLRVRNIEVTLDLAPGLPRSMMDRVQLQQVVLNLLNNGEHAIHGIRDGGKIRVLTGQRGNRLILAVEDNGPGVAPEIAARIFHPFFTTKPVGKGTGLGLAICYGIAKDHGGEIRLDPEFRGGARFLVELPVTPWKLEAGKENPEAEASPEEAPRSLAVLFVDDEEAIRSLGGEFLGSLGHTVVLAEDGAKALEILRSRDFDVILSDLRMPRIGGEELFARVVGEKPDYRGRFAFITGDVGALEPDAAGQIAEAPLVSKPFDLDELDRVVQRVARIPSGQPC